MERGIIVAFFLIFWGCITCMVVQQYMKMHAEDRESAIDAFKTPNFIFTILFLVVGALLATLGIAVTVHIINVVGLAFSGLGAIISFIFMLRENKIKSISILSLTIIAIYFFN